MILDIHLQGLKWWGSWWLTGSWGEMSSSRFNTDRSWAVGLGVCGDTHSELVDEGGDVEA